MRRTLRLLVLLALVATSFTNVLAMECTAGTAVRSPITGELVDCLEGGGNSCISCTDIIIVQAP